MAGPTIDDTGYHVHDFGGVTGLQGWLDRLVAIAKARFGDDINVDPESPDGQFLGDLAEMFNDAAERGHVIYLMNSPAGAVGTALSRLMQLTGIIRKSAQFSIVAVTLGGANGTVIPNGKLFDNPDDSDLPPFEIVGGPYTIGGGGTVTGQAQCTEAGPFNVSAGKLTRILDLVSGWDTVTNPSAAAPGRLVEPDPIARVRRAESVAMPSQSMLDGLQAALANLDGVDDVVVYENATGSYDIKGHPPHSIHVIIDGGLDADIANAIWTKASMGCTKVGSQILNVTDSQGNPQEMRWDAPVDVNVYITVQLSRDPNAFEMASIQNALVAYGQETSRIGQDVPWFDLASPINDLNITGGPGLPSVKSLFIGNAADPDVEDDLVVAFNARPRYDVTRVLVVGPP